MEMTDEAERAGKGFFGAAGRHRGRIFLDELCRPALCHAGPDDELSCSDKQPCSGALHRRGRQLEELAVAERADTLAEVPVNPDGEGSKTKKSKTTPCTVADDNEINALRRQHSRLTRRAKQEHFAMMGTGK
jgi:hypothetical protein